MIRLLVRRALRLLACAALVLAAAAPSQGAQVQLPVAVVLPVQILGADSFCTGGFVAGGTPSAPTLTCVTGPGPLTCSILGAPSGTVALNTSVSLTMSCSGGTSPYTYSWSPVSGTAATLATTVAATTTFTATATDSAIPAATFTKSVTVTVGSGGGGGGGPDTSACTALGLNPKVTVANWNGAQIDTWLSSNTNFGPNDALIVQFTTGSFTTSTVTGLGVVSGVEFNGPTTARAGALSASACDFTVGLPKYKLNKNGVPAQCANTVFSGVMGPSISFSVASQSDLVALSSCQPLLQPNTTYYWNLTNFAPPPPSGTQQCNQSACNMRITLSKPVGG